MDSFELYTDGSFKEGWGSWSFILLQNAQVVNESSGRERQTDSNRMEFQAAIEGLKVLPINTEIKLHSDSRVLLENIPLFRQWRENGWMKKNGRPIPNVDLFIILNDLIEKRRVTLKWVRAHSGNIYNERCDTLCIQARIAHKTRA